VDDQLLALRAPELLPLPHRDAHVGAHLVHLLMRDAPASALIELIARPAPIGRAAAIFPVMAGAAVLVGVRLGKALASGREIADDAAAAVLPGVKRSAFAAR